MKIKLVKPASTSEKRTSTTVDTIELTMNLVKSWKTPPFQRDLKINAKVLEVAQEISTNGGVLPGMLTIGILDGETYIVDGQHRIAAWTQTGLPVGYADVRMHWFDDVAGMAAEFVKLNSSLVRLRPDDMLRGMEASIPALQMIRRKCGFIGYDMVRRGGNHSPVMSMSVFVRVWVASKAEVPAQRPCMESVKSMDDADTKAAIDFALLCYEAWQRDHEHVRLWGALNLIVCAWLYRRVVLAQSRSSNARTHVFSKDEFRKCLMALSADPQYLDYLVGRLVRDRDLAPTYGRVKSLFQRRIFIENGKKISLPQPAWSHQ